MIALASSENKKWPWSNLDGGAESSFRQTYPAIHRHLNTFRDQLQKRGDQGKFWWELRSCAYWDAFEQPKIMYAEITWRPEWCFDANRTLCNNTAYILPSDDLYLLAVANAPLTWWFSWRRAIHGKDEALRFIKAFVQIMPIAEPTPEIRSATEAAVRRLIEITATRQQVPSTILDWLRVEFAIEKPGNKLQSPTTLDSDAFVAEVKRVRGKKQPLTAAGLQALRHEHATTIEPARSLAAEALQLECRINNLVNQAYGLTPEEIDLMWKTAPPRMPIARPSQG